MVFHRGQKIEIFKKSEDESWESYMDDYVGLHGIITDHDIKIMLSPEFGYPDPKELMVFDVYVAEPYIVDIATSLSSIATTLVDRKIGSAIVTKNDKLVGILTTRDVCRALAKYLIDRENPDDGEVA